MTDRTPAEPPGRRPAPLQVHDPFATNVLDVTELLAAAGGAGEHVVEELVDAIDGASDQGQFTWLLDAGKPVAAIVPVDSAEDILARLGEVLEHVSQAARRIRPACPEPGR